MDNTSVPPYQGHFQSLVCANPVCSQGQQAQTCPPSVASMDVSMMNSYCNYNMFSSITPSVLPAHTQGQQALPSANPFMGQLASSSLVRTSLPSCAPNILHQGMDLASLTSPPNTHQGYYGMYSPVTPVSPPYSPPPYSPGYLSNLQRNPMFHDLQMLLAEECNGVQVPANLITTGWNLMHLPSIDASASTIIGSQNVFFRHMQLQDKLLKVRIDPHVSAYGLKVENEYSIKVGEIEMGRYQDLLANMGNTVLKTAVNSYYDKERIILVQKAEADLDRLIAKAEDIQKSIMRVNVMEKKSSQGRPTKRNVVKKQRVVRQLTFGGLDDSGERDSFDSGFKSDEEDVDIEANSDNDKQINLNKNCAKVNGVYKLCSMKQNTMPDILYEDEKCSDKTSCIQPDNKTVNLSPGKPLPGKSCSVSNDNLTTTSQCRSSQSSFKCCDFGLLSKNTDICTPGLRNDPSVELSPLNDQSDFLLKTAIGSTGKFKPVQSSSQSQDQSAHVYPEFQTSSSSQQNSNLDKPTETDNSKDRTKKNMILPSSTHLPCLKTHKVLSNDAANILLMWYERHLQYPYPTDEEVKELSELTGVTGKQVKKWMANKRIRCFNTLSITGNKHPIKFKYDGRGKKRKHSEVEKDDSSSSEQNSSSLTEESRRILNNWFDSHRDNPYPLEEEKKELALQCGITPAQVKSWFANKRSRTNKTRKQIPNYFIKKFPQYVPIVEAIGQQREQARLAKKCRLNNDFTNTVPFL
ncbi:hypothetical protein CHS0354_004299 [Potamilus streckersoni]|uniref:Homeobox domain-containing protein n=1 Tax=Potamilus streckersoni TaxID=2493646 RepID=A0AAE0S4G5_9BIVA|nr:hypothetical protein CHS0354_004299 [Potamilus streckersoni]